MTLGIKDYALIGLALALGLSLWGNKVQLNQVQAARVDVAVAKVGEQNNLITANMCSDGVAKLKAAQDARAKAAKPAIEASKAAAKTGEAKAQTILATAPSTPGDACKSAEDLARAWVTGRTK